VASLVFVDRDLVGAVDSRERAALATPLS